MGILRLFWRAQDLAVVVLLMLIPLLAPTDSGAPAGLATISKALGIAALKVRCYCLSILLHARTAHRPPFPRAQHAGSMAPRPVMCWRVQIERRLHLRMRAEQCGMYWRMPAQKDGRSHVAQPSSGWF